MSERIAKVNSLIQRALSDIILLEHNHPSFKLISIVNVDTARDLSNSKVGVSSLENEEDVVKYLTKLTPVLQKKLAKKITLQKLPKLTFHLDEETAYLNHMNTLIQDVENNTENTN